MQTAHVNINKEESFNTYENRFIFTLINNMKMYVERKKNENISASNSDSNISLVYQGSSKISKNNIEMHLTITFPFLSLISNSRGK